MFIHGYILTKGLHSDLVVASALLHMYDKCEHLSEASKFFYKLQKKDVVCWGAMVAAYAQHGECYFSLQCFQDMQQAGVKPDKVIFLSILKAIGTVEQVRWIHEQIFRSRFEADIVVGSSLIDTYTKCGSLDEAYGVFQRLQNRDRVLWGVMIAGYIHHGECNLALDCFQNMQQENIKPDKVIYLSMSKASGAIGAIIQSRHIHEQIIVAGLLSDIVVTNTLVDMYLKCGNIEEAWQVFSRLQSHGTVSWNVLITGYAQLGEVSLAQPFFSVRLLLLAISLFRLPKRYVRLELLEGVVAYHSGQHEVARKSLISAQKKYEELQVSDEALALLAGMGFTAKESKRALRVSGQDVQRAVEFVMAEKARKKAKSEEDRKRQREHREQKKYGKTASGKPVDLKNLAELVSLGYDTRLAAESLRQSENDRESALDVLGNPALCDALKTSLKKKRLRRTVDEAELAELMLMGFEKERAGRALQKSLDVNEALEQLLRGEQLKPEEGASSIGPGTAGEAAPGTDSQPNSPPVDSPILEERDREMEAEIAENLTGDPLAEYDIEVDKEGVAISEYLSLLDVKAS